MDRELPRVTIEDGGTQVYYRGRNLYSPSGPQAAARRRASLVELQPQSLVFVPCPLLCYGIDSLAARLPESSRLLCVETDEALMAVTLDNLPSNLREDPRIQFIRTDSAEQITAFVHERLRIGRFRRLIIAPLNAGYSMNSGRYRMLTEALDREIRVHWQNRLTGAFFGRLWVRNLLANIGQIALGMEITSPPHPDSPIVVAGAGESLEAVLPWLRRLRSRFFLIAVDTALPALFQSGIEADLAVTVEAQWANLQDFVPLGDGCKLHLLADLSGSPAPLRLPACGSRSIFLSRFSECRIVDEIEERRLAGAVIPPLGSVGVAAVHLARRLSDGLLLLAGLDFSYRPGKPHARGTATHNLQLRSATRLTGDLLFASSIGRRRLSSAMLRREGFVTDTVLLSYARDLSSLIEQDGRIQVLGDPGVDLGAAVVARPERFEAILREESGRGRGPGRESDSTLRIPDSAAARQFLEVEEARLERLGQQVTSHLNTTDAAAREESWNLLLPEIEGADYLYFDFPDSESGPVDSPAFLRRLLGNVYGYLRKTRQALSPLR